GNDLPLQLAGADHPIDAVLQRTGQTESVFRARDENGVTLGDSLPPSLYALRHSVRLQVGVEVGQLPQAVKEQQVDARRPRRRRDLQKGQVLCVSLPAVT